MVEKKMQEIPPEVRQLLDEAQRLTQVSDMRAQASILERALALVDREQQALLWADLAVRRGNALQQIADGDVAAALSAAIEAYSATLCVYTEDDRPAKWAEVQNNLAIALRLRAGFEVGDARRDTLGEAIAAYRAALRVYTEERLPFDWAMSHNNLAIALRGRAELEAGATQRVTLDEAIAACRAALRVYTEADTPAEWAITYNSLAITLRGRAMLEAGETQRATLTEVIEAYRAALRVYTETNMPTKWAALQNNLAIALRGRAELEAGATQRATLDEAIAACRAALRVYTEDHFPLDWAMSQNSLANSLTNRAILAAGDARRAMLGEAIHASRAALTVYTPASAPTQWAMSQNNLANALWTQAALEQGTARRALFGEAIDAYHAALRVYTEASAPAEWATAQNNLGVALWDRALSEALVTRRTTLAEAIDACRAALRIYTEAGTPDQWSTTMCNLAIILRAQATLESREARYVLLGEVIDAYRAALRVRTEASTPVDWADNQNNLAVALGDRVTLESGETRRATLDAAIEAFQAALRVYRQDVLPAGHRDVARRAGLLLAREGQWSRASMFFSSALDAQDELFALGVTAQGREDVLGSGSDISALLATALLRSRGRSSAISAAIALERGRARASGEALAHQQAQLTVVGRLAPELLEAFRRASDYLMAFSLENGRGGALDAPTLASSTAPESPHSPPAYALAETARAAYDAILAQVRAVVPDFLAQDDPLTSAATRLAPHERLAYLASTSTGTVGIVVGRPTTMDGALEAEAWSDAVLTTAVLEDLLEHNGEGGEASDDHASAAPDGLLPSMANPRALGRAVRRTADALGTSDGVVAQLAAVCRAQEVGHVVIIPCGLYGFLPLHAALVPAAPKATTAARAVEETEPKQAIAGTGAPTLPDKVPLQDVMRVSYAPSARIWSSCRARARADQSPPPSVLVVGDPQPQYGVPQLPGAVAEAQEVRRLVAQVDEGQLVPPGLPLDGDEARQRPVLAALHTYGPLLSHAHFACHGVVEWDRPERSGLLLANGARLTVKDVLTPGRMTFSRLRLVTLSACRTGLPGMRLPDEVVGLPTAWLQAGAAGVLGSLWAVSDSATVALMGKFYELHFLDGLEPGLALWLAQRWLRDMPDWRQDCLEVGATLGAAGPAAPTLVEHLAVARGERNPLTDRNGALSDAPADGTHSSDDASASGDGTDLLMLHWAAFAHYGA